MFCDASFTHLRDTRATTDAVMICRHDQEIMFGCGAGEPEEGEYLDTTKQTHYTVITTEGKVSALEPLPLTLTIASAVPSFHCCASLDRCLRREILSESCRRKSFNPRATS